MPSFARKDHLSWFPVAEARPEAARTGAGSVQALAASIHQFASASLDGPHGVDPATLVAGLGALAGYGARFIVREGIREGAHPDDFVVPRGVNARHVSMSDRVTALVCDMTRDSYAATLATAILARGGQWLPDIRQDLMHNFMAINSPSYPDYTLAAAHLPKIPPQTVLLMLWDRMQARLRATEGAREDAMMAFALATATAAEGARTRLPLHVSAQLATETAIAMSKIDYGF